MTTISSSQDGPRTTSAASRGKTKVKAAQREAMRRMAVRAVSRHHGVSLSADGERDILLGRDGSKWRHGWIPLNPTAAAIKAKKWKGHGGAEPKVGEVRKAAKTRLKAGNTYVGPTRTKAATPEHAKVTVRNGYRTSVDKFNVATIHHDNGTSERTQHASRADAVRHLKERTKAKAAHKERMRAVDPGRANDPGRVSSSNVLSGDAAKARNAALAEQGAREHIAQQHPAGSVRYYRGREVMVHSHQGRKVKISDGNSRTTHVVNPDQLNTETKASHNLRITSGTFRGENGHHVTGKTADGKSVKVFTPGDRTKAEAARRLRDIASNPQQYGSTAAKAQTELNRREAAAKARTVSEARKEFEARRAARRAGQPGYDSTGEQTTPTPKESKKMTAKARTRTTRIDTPAMQKNREALGARLNAEPVDAHAQPAKTLEPGRAITFTDDSGTKRTGHVVSSAGGTVHVSDGKHTYTSHNRNSTVKTGTFVKRDPEADKQMVMSYRRSNQYAVRSETAPGWARGQRREYKAADGTYVKTYAEVVKIADRVFKERMAAKRKGKS